MFTYMQLKNVLPGFSVTITQSCLGAYLYSVGTEHGHLLKLLVMTSMVICHQKIKGHMNTELKLTNKSHW